MPVSSVSSVSDLIEQQVRTRPDATAVVSRPDGGGEHRLTYRQLSRAANRLAAHLIARGIARGKRVATSLRPGPDLVTAFLAIARAGAAYVPLDPDAPAERRRLIVRNSGARAVIGTEGPDGPDAVDHRVPFICLRADARAIAAHDGALPAGAPSPDDTAYVCCVAGSTGAPHGIPVSHGALLEHLTTDARPRPAPEGVLPSFENVAFEAWMSVVGRVPTTFSADTDAGIDADAGTRSRTQPGTPLQEIVRDLFAEALGLPRYAVHAESDFFRLGGRSRSAACLLPRVRETFGGGPGRRALRRAPTPAAFAALVGDGPVAFTGPGGAGADSALLPLKLLGRLDARTLERALEDLGARHEALRNSRLGAAGTRLRSLGPEEHLLELALPATSVDMWSHLPLAADLADAYGARATGAAPHRSPAGLAAAPRAVSGGVPPTLLPGSTPQPYGSRYGSLAVELEGALHARLTRFAAERGTTLFMVAHAALATVLTPPGVDDDDGRCCHVTVAAPVPARDCAGLRCSVGPFGRVLALSVDVSGDPAFAELLQRVQTADLAAYRDGDAPLAQPGGVALTVLQDQAGAARFRAAGLTVCPGQPQLPLPTVDLNLALTERQTLWGESAGLTLSVSYRHETVHEAIAASVTGRLTAVLQAALDTPTAPLSRLRPLPGRQRDGGVWAGPGTGVPAPGTLTARFAYPIALTPQADTLPGIDGPCVTHIGEQPGDLFQGGTPKPPHRAGRT
jgi:non-ribosomal peptide synthetase component F